MKLLVVEDKDPVLRLIEEILKPMGWETDSAMSITKAEDSGQG